jgi:hypothetical protein
VRVMLVGANDRVRAMLEKAGITGLIGEENSFQNLGEALAVCQALAESDPRMARAKPMLLSESAEAVLRTSREYFGAGPR